MQNCVKTKNGVFEGHVLQNGVVEFLGIPYVKKPERWKKAVEPEASDEIFKADKYGAVCWQHVFDEEWERTPVMSEDCLTLNIWTSDISKKKKPVMVWIHGGSYYTGGSCIDCCNGVYCGDQFAEDCPDIIYINFNYRLNIFGMIDLGSIDKTELYSDSINLTTMDQIAALKWIHDNIEAFGGDVDNITVFGQSAGGGSVSTLCCVPEANRYFSKAIIQSAGLSDNTLKRKEDSAKIGKSILEWLGASSMEELIAMPPKKLVSAAEWYFDEVGGDNVGPFDPTWGVGMMPDAPLDGLRNGVAEHLTVMTGTTSGEYSSWVAKLTENEICEMAKEASGNKLTQEMIEAFISDDKNRGRRDALIDLHMDVLLRGIQNCILEALVDGGSKVYNYYISCVPEGASYKPQHCFEIPYIVGKPMNYIYLDISSGEPCQGRNPEMKLVGELQGCWATFARYGNPNGTHISEKWKPYTLENRETLVIDKQLELVNGVRNSDMDIVKALHHTK